MDTEDNTSHFKFLDSDVIHPSPEVPLKLRYYSKNTPHIKSHGTQLFYQYQHFDSYSIDLQKRGTVISTFCRIARSTTDPSDLLLAYFNAIDQFVLLNYPIQFLRKCVLSMLHNPAHDMDIDTWSSLRSYLPTPPALPPDPPS